MPSVKTTRIPWPIIQGEVAFKVAENVYKTIDHRLVVADPQTNEALLIEIEPTKEEVSE